MKKVKGDVIKYDRSLPAEMFPTLQELVGYTLSTARYYLKYKKEVLIKVAIENRRKDFLSHGSTTKKSIFLLLSKKYLYSKKLDKGLPSTLIHEYTHYLRLNLDLLKSKTIFESMIEEGIAIYIQTKISFNKPIYLDLKNLNKEMIKVYAYKLSQVLDKSSSSKVHKRIISNKAYRAIYYRLGYWLVREYAKENKTLSLDKISRIQSKKILNFSETYIKKLL